MNELSQSHPSPSSAGFVEFDCPDCRVRLKVDGKLAGQPAKCPKCSQVTTVPGKRPVATNLPNVARTDPANDFPNARTEPAAPTSVVNAEIPIESAVVAPIASAAQFNATPADETNLQW